MIEHAEARAHGPQPIPLHLHRRPVLASTSMQHNDSLLVKCQSPPRFFLALLYYVSMLLSQVYAKPMTLRSSVAPICPLHTFSGLRLLLFYFFGHIPGEGILADIMPFSSDSYPASFFKSANCQCFLSVLLCDDGILPSRDLPAMFPVAKSCLGLEDHGFLSK